MEPWEENEEKIEQYLEGKMSLDEEELFMQELNTNEELRKQYEEELLISALLNDENDEKDEIKISVTNSNANNDVAEKKEKRKYNLSFLGKHSLAIAAIVVIIIVTAIFFAVKTQRPVQQTVSADTNAKQPSITSVDSVNNQPSLHTHTASYVSELYQKFYAPYVAKNDPVEVSAYYTDYKQKNYKKVLTASDGDYQIMGAESNQLTLNNYMHLYKGLCFLEKEEPENAVKQFDSLLKRVVNVSPSYEAKWYKALSYTKLNEIDSATNTLSSILKTHSPYKKQAEQLLNELKKTK